MKQVPISFLKKEAKLLRKNNVNIKNHNDSLNEISNKYGFNKWQDLLDSCYLNIEEQYSTKKKEKSELKIEQITKEKAVTLSLLLTVKNELKKEYLRFEKLKNRNDGHIVDYIKNIVLSNYSGDQNLEKKRTFALIDYIVGNYFLYSKCLEINEYKDYLSPCNLENIFEFGTKHNKYQFDYESMLNNSEIIKTKNSLSVDMDSYINIIDINGNFYSLNNQNHYGNNLQKILSTGKSSILIKHQEIYIHLKQAIDVFKIFEEINNLANTKNIDDAIYFWLSNYNNTPRLKCFKDNLRSHTKMYIDRIEDYDLKHDDFTHDQNINILQNEKIKVISLYSCHKIDYDIVSRSNQSIKELNMYKLIEILSNKSNLNLNYLNETYISDLNGEKKELDLSKENISLYLDNLILKAPFVDIFGHDFLSSGYLNFYFIEK